MEDDDEFGDLYTDVLRPLTASFQSQRDGSDAAASSQSRPIDLNANRDDEEILLGAPNLERSENPNSAPVLNLNASIQETILPEAGAGSERGGFDLNLEASRSGDDLESGARVLERGEGAKLPEKASGGLNFMEEDDDINIVVEEKDNRDDELVDKDVNLMEKQENMFYSSEPNENTANLTGPSGVGEGVSEQMIPGLSGRLENQGGSNFDDEWESDESEDDLQIVLNDNLGPVGMERMPGMDDEDDDEEDQLVIVADNGDIAHLHHHHHHQHMMEDQEWAGEEGGPGADGEKKEDATKSSGGATAPSAAVQPKIGYSNHVYHHPFHSQFKYVRPGAAPIPGAAPVPPGGPGQVRPPVPMGTVAGRGRGDWRPLGIKGAVPMQKGFVPGYGMPAWGANAAGRGYGSGLDFTLPSHKTIFEVDIEGFEEKPWRLSGIDVSDFFNFGLNEDGWKDYCKQLEQLRLETTMQSKIRVYESGRAEQDYDPDLPPELAAAAVGNQDVPSEDANPGKTVGGPTDLATANARGRPPVQPIGRPIPVETGSGDRLPSIDTRRPRMHDSDTIIEIVCQRSTEDDDMAQQQANNLAGEDLQGVDEIEQDDVEHIDRLSHAYNGRKRELVARVAQCKSTVNSDAEEPVQGHPNRELCDPHEEWSTKGRSRMNSSKMTAEASKREKQIMDDENEESFHSEDGKQSTLATPSYVLGSDGEQTAGVGDGVNDESIIDDRSFDVEREEVSVDATTSDAVEDGNLVHSTKKQKVSSRMEQLSIEKDDREDSKGARSSENSKGRSGSSKDHRDFHDGVNDEVLQDRRSLAGNVRRPIGNEDNAREKGGHDRDETGRQHMAVKERESYSRRGGDPNSSLNRLMKNESADWRKESDISEGNWHHKDDDFHRRRIKAEDTRNEVGSRHRGKAKERERSKKDEQHQSRNQLDNGNWREANQDQDVGSRKRDWNDHTKPRNEKVDDHHSKRRKEGAHVSRERSEKEEIAHNHSRTKRGRDDASDHRRRDDHARVRDDDKQYVKRKEEESFRRERSERLRDRDEWHRLEQSHDDILSRREREETRPVMRSGAAVEDKMWTTHSRGKDDYRGSSREYHLKDASRHRNHLKRRDQVENESFPQHKGHEDVYARGNQLRNDGKRARYEKPGDERAAYASDTSRLHDHRQKEGRMKSKEAENGARSSLIPSKRNQDEHSGQISETVNLRGRTEGESGENDINPNLQSSRKQGEEAPSDDEQTSSRRGRSKFERWTSHKERDLSIVSKSSSSLKNKDQERYDNNEASLASKHPDEPSKEVEANAEPSVVEDKETGAEVKNVNANTVKEAKNLDTVEKLKKRSERFKLPIPSGKDAVIVKKMEGDSLPSAQTETRPDSDIKPERPARKRRWTGN